MMNLKRPASKTERIAFQTSRLFKEADRVKADSRRIPFGEGVKLGDDGKTIQANNGFACSTGLGLG
jgi:hypothetical protein